MSNSSLVDYTLISPNSNNPRNNSIKKITIHHMAGDLSIEECGREFSNAERQASSNYGIGSDGRVGLYVEEENRAWTSSSPANDNQAITIEVADDGDESTNWHVSDTALAKLIDLCVDICRRNGIASLNFTGDASGNLTMHRYFTATACPGEYLASKFPYIAESVNTTLNGTDPEPTTEPSTPVEPEAPTDNTTDPEVFVSVNIGGKEGWLPSVPGAHSDINNIEGDGCGGMIGRTIEAVNVALKDANFTINYAVHTIDGRTLPTVSTSTSDINNGDTGFAGSLGHEIDGVLMCVSGSDEYDIKYQVQLSDGTVLPAVYGSQASWEDSDNGYGGSFGKRIQAITAALIKK